MPGEWNFKIPLFTSIYTWLEKGCADSIIYIGIEPI